MFLAYSRPVSEKGLKQHQGRRQQLPCAMEVEAKAAATMGVELQARRRRIRNISHGVCLDVAKLLGSD